MPPVRTPINGNTTVMHVLKLPRDMSAADGQAFTFVTKKPKWLTQFCGHTHRASPTSLFIYMFSTWLATTYAIGNS